MMGMMRFLGMVVVGGILALCPCPCATTAHADTLASAQTTVTVKVDGMTCSACSVAVRTVLKKLNGVVDAKVSVSDKQAVVEYDASKVTPQQMVDAIIKLGYRASLPTKSSS